MGIGWIINLDSDRECVKSILQHVEDIAWGAQLQWILIVWAYWVDTNRQIDVV
jgi:hypothetical protein